jgi:cellulose synthase/poly-beta-1,6-N-acetylglucosamine synthase-like glycosyltransferase
VLPHEVLLADDGSEQSTRTFFKQWAERQTFRGRHVWQERDGFRRARILNQAIANVSSQYLVFLDGDTVPHPSFVADHLKLGLHGTFVQGHRALIEKKGAVFFGTGNFGSDLRRVLISGQLHGLKHAFRWPLAWRRYRKDLRGTRGCNLAIWLSDLRQVNGYNEAFVGWGREDSELALRLMNSGVRRVDARGWALCYHLWHPPASRDNLATNDKLLETAIDENSARCQKGLNQHSAS